MKAVDLFAGCGGLSLGFMLERYKIQCAFENWKPAIDCYSKNFKHEIFEFDLSDIENSVDLISKYSPDIIIGGPPCQDFSHAGKRKEGTRADLTNDFAEIVISTNSQYFVMENVDRAKNSIAYEMARQKFKDASYGLTEIVLDASLCGVPQKRKRFFCIGCKNENDNFLNELLIKNLSAKPMTIRDLYGDSFGIEHYYRHPRNYNRRAIFSIDEPAPTIRGVNRPVPSGYHGHKGDSKKLTKEIRQLTTRERALLQTFPPNFIFDSTKTDAEQLIGNAVPVNLARFVAKALMKFNKNKRYV